VGDAWLKYSRSAFAKFGEVDIFSGPIKTLLYPSRNKLIVVF
jgi:hypothetical protein